MAKLFDQVLSKLDPTPTVQTSVQLRRASNSENFGVNDSNNQPYTVTIKDSNAPAGVSHFAGHLTDQSTTDPNEFTALVTCEAGTTPLPTSDGNVTIAIGDISLDTSHIFQAIHYEVT